MQGDNSTTEDPMRLRLAVLTILGLVLVSIACATRAEKPSEMPAAVCPVSGQPIDKSVAVDYLGGKVYFCCKGCPPKFAADTAKYAAKADEQMVITGQAHQVACPLSGKKCDGKHTLKVDGVEVQFCCPMCPKKVAAADPAAQVEMVFGTKGFEKGFKVGDK